MITLLRLREHRLVLLQLLLVFPRGAVDALQTGVVLVAAPIGRRGAGQREGGDVAGRRDVRTTAQVRPLDLVGARVDVVVRRQVAGADFGGLVRIGVDVAFVPDQLELERLLGEFFGGGLGGGVDAALETLTGLDDLLHPLLDGLEVLRSEGLGDLEVVVEAVFDGRADAQLGTGELQLHGLGEDVGAGVPDHGTAVFGVRRDRGEFGLGVRDVGKILQLSLGVLDADDGLGALVRQAQLTHRGADGSAGGDDERCGHLSLAGIDGSHIRLRSFSRSCGPRHTWPSPTS